MAKFDEKGYELKFPQENPRQSRRAREIVAKG